MKAIVVYSVLVALVLNLVGCATQTKIVIQDEMVAEWMAVSNTFAEGGHKENVGGIRKVSRVLWNGVLYQLGDQEDDGDPGPPPVEYTPTYKYDGIHIEGKDGLVRDYPRDDFTWINVYAYTQPDPTLDNSDSNPNNDYITSEPLDPASNHPFLLFSEDPSFYGIACREDPVCGCACSGAYTRRLNSHLQTMSMITFWHGRKGYDLKARPKAQPPQHDRFIFTANDPVTVVVYTKNGLEMDYVETLSKVTRIEVRALLQSNHGLQLDPPW